MSTIDQSYMAKWWLQRVEKALWRMHKFSKFDSWEERHYYDGLRFIINHRTNNDGY